jgi:hypothetical protein
MSMDGYDIIREYRQLRVDIDYPFEKLDSTVNEHDRIEMLEKQRRLKHLVKRMEEITPAELSQCKKNLRLSVEKAIELLSIKNVSGFRLSRDQGMVVANYIFGKVIGIVESALNSAQGFGYPQIFYEKDSDFDPSEFIHVLNEFKNRLNNSHIRSFQQLERLYYEFYDKAVALWRKENDDQRKKGRTKYL